MGGAFTHSHMKRTASAVWQGSLKAGKGALTAPGGALKNTEYSFGSRFESGAGTNPEELIAAAHAGCFAMALSAELGKAGFTPDRLDVTAEVSLDNVPPAGWTVTASHLVLTAKIPGIDAAKFDAIAAGAKAGCPISRLLNAKVTLAATLA
jgi:osmotically inducible protein OsmC